MRKEEAGSPQDWWEMGQRGGAGKDGRYWRPLGLMPGPYKEGLLDNRLRILIGVV